MQEWTIDDGNAGTRLDVWLARRTEVGSRRRAAEWLARGKVYVDGHPVDGSAAAHPLRAGVRVGLWPDRPGSARGTERSVVPARRLLHLVHTDAAVLVVDKPAGLLVEPLPEPETRAVTLLDLLRDHFGRAASAGLRAAHRIDRDTSGLVVFARTPAAAASLRQQFDAHTPERLYQAVVLGLPRPPRGTWRDRLAWDTTALRQRRAHGRDAEAKEAVANYTVREPFATAALLEVSLVTGKRNQIRVQAALRGHPLLGERQYRFDAPPEPPGTPTLGRHALHAWRLTFRHPLTAEPLTFTAPLPADLTNLLAELRRATPASGGT